MKKNMKILFPVNFTEGSKKAANTIVALEEHYKVDVHLLHCIPSFWKNWFTSGDAEKEAGYRLESWQKNYFDQKDKEHIGVEIGSCSDSIIEAAKKKKVDMIVMGGSGLTGTSRYRTSTCAADVVRYATMPVWICRKEKISKILCAIDLSSHSDKTLKYALNICERFKLELDLLYVYPAIVTPFGIDEKKLREEESRNKQENIKKVEKFIKNAAKGKKVKINSIFHEGSPANNILDLAEDRSYDLVVMGARGESTLTHVLLGSVADKVIRHISCSLLVVK